MLCYIQNHETEYPPATQPDNGLLTDHSEPLYLSHTMHYQSRVCAPIGVQPSRYLSIHNVFDRQGNELFLLWEAIITAYFSYVYTYVAQTSVRLAI